MKFSLFAIPAFIAGVLAAPAITQQKRQVGDLVSQLESLVSDVTALTGQLNDTAVGVGAAGVNAQVNLNIQETLDTVVTTIEDVVTATGAITLVDDVVGETETYIAALLTTVIEEINGALGNVEGLVGLGRLLFCNALRILLLTTFQQTTSPAKSPASPPSSAVFSTFFKALVSRTSSPPSLTYSTSFQSARSLASSAVLAFPSSSRCRSFGISMENGKQGV